MLKDFKNFIMTGNVIEFAIGVIMAGAIGAVVSSFVADIVMPLVGMIGAGDFSSLKYVLSPEVKDAAGVVTSPENAVRYGTWITTITNLVVVGFVMFLIVKAYAKMKKPAPDAPPAGPTQEELLSQIRDLLKK
jgi:large conductance mechanosensitive channel